MFSSYYNITKWLKIAGFYIWLFFQKKNLSGNLYIANIVCKKCFLFQVEIKEKCYWKNQIILPLNTLVGNNNVPPRKNVESLYGIMPYNIVS